ncbi:hypothetical protein [Mangrovimonas futianensis]|uniref:hypothetical protein n=1 Tax=Mangrovimonas futianensis TaxID=2895523 RepID=UPI001E5B83C7|nr:hypothetical protein [Mangrovimonas futianensis]MCF1420963.1 hypothetical protein [Mangrovimonas futianensis]
MRLCFLLIATVITSVAFSQNRDDRKGHLFLKVGPEYRITPLPYNENSSPSEPGYLTDIDSQSAGFVLNYSLDYFIIKDLSIGFAHSFHYTLLNTNTYHAEDFGMTKANYRLFMDFHLYLDFHVKVFKTNELFLRAGVSLFNRNSKFGTKQSYYDSDGNYIAFSVVNLDYNYSPNQFALGYKTQKLELLAGVYYSKQTEYFNTPVKFAVPFVKLNFNLFKF